MQKLKTIKHIELSIRQTGQIVLLKVSELYSCLMKTLKFHLAYLYNALSEKKKKPKTPWSYILRSNELHVVWNPLVYNIMSLKSHTHIMHLFRTIRLEVQPPKKYMQMLEY